MVRIAINILGWNHAPELVCTCIDAVLKQTFRDFEIVFTDNASQNKLATFVQEKYKDCERLTVVANAVNAGYSGGHNRFISAARTEFVMVLNPDAILDRAFLGSILPVFGDSTVAAATGKMLKSQRPDSSGWVLDGTGIIINHMRIPKERGQLEIDRKQYDDSHEVFGVSGTAAIYRKSALEDAVLKPGEYFDEDFFAYSEDWDLCWRLRLLGYSIRYVPDAVVYHERVVGQVKFRATNPLQYVSRRRGSSKMRHLGWRNRILAIIKNDFGPSLWKVFPLLLGREVLASFYLMIFETESMALLPSLFRLLPRMVAKRKTIRRKRKVTSKEVTKWFGF